MSESQYQNQLTFELTETQPTTMQAQTEPSQPKIHSVSSLNLAIKNSLEKEFALVWLQGEISNFKPHSSGHFYFSLKDEKAQINVVMFKGFNSHLKFKPENGLEVIVRGRVTVYPPRGQYQMFCEVMEPVGLGALQLQFEQLKTKLQAEGLFDSKRKKTIPSFPQRVAIITSPTGAAIRDMLNVLNRRYKALEIILVPATVQGSQAPQEIVTAIQQVQKLNSYFNFDVMILGRGGGSMEDLWAFNDEAVARAIASSSIPTVSGVGHEIDFTISDFVADLRAPTPSAAAELIVKNAVDLEDRLMRAQSFLKNYIVRKLQFESQKLNSFRKLLVDPKRKLLELAQRCDEYLNRLEKIMLEKIKFSKNRIVGVASLLDSLSPLKVMDRGYAIVLDSHKKVLKSVKNAKINELIKVQLQDGSLEATIKDIKETRHV